MPARGRTMRVAVLAAMVALTAIPGCSPGGGDRGGTTGGDDDHDGTAIGGTPAGSGPFGLDALDPAVAETVFTVRTTTCGTSNRQRAVAVAVDEATIATVAHVFASAGSLLVAGPDGSELTGELAWIDPGRDLALVALDEQLDAWLEPGTAADGADVTIVTVEEETVVARPGRLIRHVTATLDGAGQRAALELEAAVERGESGSPVVARDGRLVGLVFAASRGDERGWALDVSEISRALGAVSDDPVALDC